MSEKFIPNGDIDFVMMAEHFARTISADPGRFAVAASSWHGASGPCAAYVAAIERGLSTDVLSRKEDRFARADIG